MATLFIGFFLFTGFFVLFLNIKTALRCGTARRHWRKTRGKVEKFTHRYGEVSITYSYSVAGETYSGNHLCVSPFSSRVIGAATSLAPAFYLNKEGGLRFEPGSGTDVYFDPTSPADAALVVERANINGVGVAMGLLLVAAGAVLYTHNAWLAAHALKGSGCLFLILSLPLFNVGWKYVCRHRASLKALPVSGRITGGELHFLPGRERNKGANQGGYTPHIEFEYAVGGRPFSCTQISALSLRVTRDAATAQRELDRWLQKQHVTVYHLPERPWDAFLLHGPKGAMLLPLIMGLCSAGFGVVLIVLG